MDLGSQRVLSPAERQAMFGGQKHEPAGRPQLTTEQREQVLAEVPKATDAEYQLTLRADADGRAHRAANRYIERKKAEIRQAVARAQTGRGAVDTDE
jgi:hypothetical protein